VPGPGYLLDTDWIIDHLSGVDRVSQKILELNPAGLAVSIISVAELYEGVHFSRDPVKSLASFRRFLNGMKIVSLDEDICSWFGKERGRLRKTGRIVGDFDLLIGGTAIRHGLTLCTNNRRHFEMIDDLRLLSIDR
jgi:tRNA(fMet)-specific endonuclease VapC